MICGMVDFFVNNFLLHFLMYNDCGIILDKEKIMEILIFIGGFILGAICVFVPFYFAQKNNQANFENLANRIFKENSAEFSVQNRERLDEFFKLFKERIEDFEKRTEENFKQEKESFTIFDMNIKNFLETGNKISLDANALINVMKSDNRTSGKWGEIVLERVLEASGLRKDEEYKIQVGSSEGRPDATVFLPDDRCIYIDSKTSFASWEGYVNSDNEYEKEVHLKQFIDSTKSHIAGLAKRDYSADEKSPDYVLMFIPIESCYAMLFCNDCSLWDYAWKNKVMPVSPSTLLAALKIINSFHMVDRQNKNAMEISRICTKMIDKFADLLGDMNKIKTAFNSAMTRLQGRDNIINQLTRIEELGVKGTKNMPEVPENID